MEKVYIQFIAEIKESILRSRFRAASLANREMLLLYYRIGSMLSAKVQHANWGSGIIQNIATDLQKELPGLGGFSFSNLKNMRQIAEEYAFLNLSQLSETDFSQPLADNTISQSATVQIAENEISQLLTVQFQSTDLFIENIFFKTGFTHHILLLNKCKDFRERLFYMQKTVENQWSVTILEHQLESNLYGQKGKLLSNFDNILPTSLRKHATDAFKGEYLLDFVNIEEEDDERVLEQEIVRNIKKFIMSVGNDFAFMGNQYRITVEEEEFFIDLLFFHRKLQSLIAFELKQGKFKAEYAGKMNLYLSALDESVKQEHENPSIGIILCKEKTDKVVEFAFRDYNKAMGVATFKTSRQLPHQFKGILPDLNELKNLL